MGLSPLRGVQHHLAKRILLVDDEPHRQYAGTRRQRRKRRIAGEGTWSFSVVMSMRFSACARAINACASAAV